MQASYCAVLPEVKDNAWRWSFHPVIEERSEVFTTEQEAFADLAAVRRDVCAAGWHNVSNRNAILKAVVERRRKLQQLQHLSQSSTLAFARLALSHTEANNACRGFPNLGNTCYINSVVQCLIHCAPFRHDLEKQPLGASFMGDCLKNLWATYRNVSSNRLDLQLPLTMLVRQILRQAGFAGGAQQDAAECLMHLLQAVDVGRMQERVCGSLAASSVDGTILCRSAAEAHVSREAPPVSMANMLVGSLTDDQAMHEDPPALVVRVENIYEEDEQHFAVDALADWSVDSLELGVLGVASTTTIYAVAGYVAHVHTGEVEALQRMRSGHYIAYLHVGGAWYEANDVHIRELASPPTAFPYLVFLTRSRQQRTRGKQAISSNAEMLELLQRRAQGDSSRGREGRQSGSGSEQDGSGRHQDKAEPSLPQPCKSGRAQDRSGRAQHRSGRAQDQSGRAQVRDVRDESGRAQDRGGRAQDRDLSGMDPRVDRAWGISSQGDNRDHSRSDSVNCMDNPLQRYKEAWNLRRSRADETCKEWHDKAEPSLPQPCRLCQNQEFLRREDWLRHVDEEHGGLQRYRNALFSQLALSPYVVKGQEWRAIVANYSEFFARSAMDWENFTTRMEQDLQGGIGLPPSSRWAPRSRQACVFCARLMWREDVKEVFLAGPSCFMTSPALVAELLDWNKYHEHWPKIPEAELKASAVNLREGNTEIRKLVLLHKRRVNQAQASGKQEVFVCTDCHEAFKSKKPQLCKYCLAQHLWLGRWDPLFRGANIAHQMLLALARIVTTKVVLRPEGRTTSQSGQQPTWDFLFHQSGMIGTAIVFGNASCTKAMASFPPQSVSNAFAVSFVSRPKEQPGMDASDETFKHEGLGRDAQHLQQEAQKVVRGIAKLKIDRAEFDAQAAALRETNVVYKDADDLTDPS